jgi:hypothetical protein
MKNLLFCTASLYILILLNNVCNAQVTTLGNFSGNAADYSGWDAGVNFDFNVRHLGARHINFGTNGVDIMRVASYGNASVGNVGGAIRPKFMSLLTNANASTTVFESVAIRGLNSYSALDTEEFINIAIDGHCRGDNWDDGYWNMAGRFQARFALHNVGVESFVQDYTMNNNTVGRLGWGIRGWATDHINLNIGISGRAAPHPEYLNSQVVGVYGGVDGGGSNMWAGWFEGPTFTPGAVWTGSDETFKSNIEEIGGALEIINQLNPKSYHFNLEEYSFMNFPEGVQYGVLAQELGEVLPTLVKEATRAEMIDTLGTVLEEELTFKTVNYTGLIPILIAGMKEQQAIIDAQNELLAEVLDRLNAIENCCNPDGTRSTPGTNGFVPEKSNQEKSIEGGNALNQNVPNPFRESTTISYNLENGGKVLLAIHDKNGKTITTLADANQNAGHYSVIWNANGIPSGVYNYALYVDGELLVKRALKLKD